MASWSALLATNASNVLTVVVAFVRRLNVQEEQEWIYQLVLGKSQDVMRWLRLWIVGLEANVGFG